MTFLKELAPRPSCNSKDSGTAFEDGDPNKTTLFCVCLELYILFRVWVTAVCLLSWLKLCSTAQTGGWGTFWHVWCVVLWSEVAQLAKNKSGTQPEKQEMVGMILCSCQLYVCNHLSKRCACISARMRIGNKDHKQVYCQVNLHIQGIGLHVVMHNNPKIIEKHK